MRDRVSTVVGTEPAPAERSSELTLAHVLEDARMPLNDTLIIRHTYKPDGLRSPAAVTPDLVHRYTRGQLVTSLKFPEYPPKWWVILLGEPQCRARLYTVYENSGEVRAERTAINRFYDLKETDTLVDLRGRLLIQWTRDPINWVKYGEKAWSFPVLAPRTVW